MTQSEFLNSLRRALNGQVSSDVVSENIEYYRSYISGELAKGRREDDILNELGDPRLIARTIIAAGGQARKSSGYSASYTSDENDNFCSPQKKSRWPWILLLLLVVFLLVVFFIFKTLFRILVSLKGLWFWAIVLIVIFALSRRR